MIEEFAKIIDGATYKVTQLPARRALKLKAKLIKIFGSVFASFLSNKDEQTLSDALEAFSKNVDENQFENIVVELLSGVRKDGIELTPHIIDIEFSGDMAGIYKVCAFVIEVNYANFFQIMGIGNIFSDSTIPVPSPDLSKRDYTRK